MVKKKILYCGCGFLGLAILKVISNNDNLQLIVFIKNKDHSKSENEIFKYCKLHKITTITGTSLAAETSQVRVLDSDLIFVCSFGELLPAEFVEEFTVVNLHPSLLPKYRGATPVVNALLNNEKSIGISIIKLVKRMDAGNLYLQKKLVIDGYSRNLQTVYAAIISECEQNLVMWLIDIISNRLQAETKQNDNEATYCAKFKNNFNKINLNQDAKDVIIFINSLVFHYKPFLFLEKKKLIIHQVDREYRLPITQQQSFNVGDIVNFTRFYLIIKCRRGVLKIMKMQWPGKKVQNCADFYNGYRTCYQNSCKIN